MSGGLSDPQFRSLAAAIAAVSGIHVATEKRWLLAARVEERRQETGAPDVARYVDRVLSTEGLAELGQLVEALRVGETQFFRHKSQLRAIRRVALPEIVARREADEDRTVRVWSAGCATGEEPYTLAMLLEDALPRASRLAYEVLATDLSEPALARAREARYPKAAARTVPPGIAAWAIAGDGDEHVRIADRVRRTVRFERRNLLDALYPRGFDLVVCRNVLIYFDRATQRDVLARLARSVVPGGYLALGYAERLEAPDADLAPLRTEDGVIYRRAGLDDAESRPGAPTFGARAAAPARSSEKSRRGRPPRRPSVPPTAARGDARSPRDGGDARSAAKRSAASEVVSLAGELVGETGASTARDAVATLLASGAGEHALDLSALRFADEGVGRILARAAVTARASGHPIFVVAPSDGILRFLRRHGVVPAAVVVIRDSRTGPSEEEP